MFPEVLGPPARITGPATVSLTGPGFVEKEHDPNFPLEKTNSYSKPHEKWMVGKKKAFPFEMIPLFLEDMLIFRGGVPFCFF